MKIQIDVDLKIPRWVRYAALVLTPAALLGTAAVVYADVPNVFADGDTLSAQKLNDNFSALSTALAQASTFTNPSTMEQYSDGSVCGQTAPVNGNIGGYAAAKALCKAACNGSATAHMCEAHELIRWQATNGQQLPAKFWIATGVDSYYDDGILKFRVNDCGAFKNGTPAMGASIWNSGGPAIDTCDAVNPVACCD